MKMTDEEFQRVLDRWHEDSLTEEEMRELTNRLEEPEAREMMRQDWFLDAALPQSLATSEVLVRTPQPSLTVRCRAWLTSWLTASAPRSTRVEQPELWTLRVWLRASLAALTVGTCVTLALTWTPRERVAEDFTPRQIAAAIVSNQLPDSQ